MKGILNRAFESGEILTIIYMDDKGQLSQRRIRIRTINDNQFSAYCFAKNQLRTFKMNNILSIGLDCRRKGA
jgi:predicted DNA-binding transcriptional regulator YafY